MVIPTSGCTVELARKPSEVGGGERYSKAPPQTRLEFLEVRQDDFYFSQTFVAIHTYAYTCIQHLWRGKWRTKVEENFIVLTFVMSEFFTYSKNKSFLKIK